MKKKEPIVESSGTEPDDARHLWEMLVNTGTELIHVIPEDKIKDSSKETSIHFSSSRVNEWDTEERQAASLMITP